MVDGLVVKHFGVMSKDPLEGAYCPACRGQVAPRTHYCKTCFATYNPKAAIRQMHVEMSTAVTLMIWLPLLPGIAIALLGFLAWTDPEGDGETRDLFVGLVLASIAPVAYFALWLFARFRLRTIERPIEAPPTYR